MKITRFIILLIGMSLLFASCIKEEEYLTDGAVKLSFSEDTVMFDTVFATMGTTTRVVKVYNGNEGCVKIDWVTVKGGAASRFRINVDGDSSMVARDVEIAAGDSIFVFVQANINPNDQTSPYLVEDAIVFNFNNKQQELPLMAYGRNAVYHLPDHKLFYAYINEYDRPDTVWYPYSIIDCDSWNHSLPHVIFGYAVVNSNETLHLVAGDELYFGNDGYLWVYDSATLDVHGQQNRPVLFTSLRHDGHYDTLPGQWGYIWMSSGSKDNYVEWARIENGTVGIVVDTNVNANPTLDIRNCIVENHSLSGIVGQGAYIVGDNLLVDNCGSTLLSLQYGGRYRFSNSTFANYWRYNSRKSPSVILNNYYRYDRSTVFLRNLDEVSFLNCIIYGSYSGQDNSGEIMMDVIDDAAFNLNLSHCILRTGLIDSMDFPYGRLLINRDPKFVDPTGHNYYPAEDSPAIGAGNAAYLNNYFDLGGSPRGNPPTIGAYERLEN